MYNPDIGFALFAIAILFILWFDPFSKPKSRLPKLSEVHRWAGSCDTCELCHHMNPDDPIHLQAHELIKFEELHGETDINDAWQMDHSMRRPGDGAISLYDLADAVFHADLGAAVYTASNWPGKVFVELSPDSRTEEIRREADKLTNQLRPAGVQVVFVGMGA